jgi:glucokinase
VDTGAGDDSPRALALDIGGSKVNAALVDKDGHIGPRETYAGPMADYAIALGAVSRMVERLVNDRTPVAAAGVSIAGMLSADRKVLRQSIFPDWRGRPVASDLERACSMPVTVENDGNAAAWGEYSCGAGRGTTTFVLIALGTGVGGGIVIDGKVHRGAHGIAAELGHVCVSDPGIACGCGGSGCLEAYGSGRRLIRDYAMRAELRGVVSDSPSEGLRRAIEAAFARDLAQGRREAVELLADIGQHVGRAVDIVVRVLDPDAIAIGGGVSALGRPLLTAIEQGAEAARSHVRAPRHTRLVLADLRNDAGLVGAAALAWAVRDRRG